MDSEILKNLGNLIKGMKSFAYKTARGLLNGPQN